MRMWQIACLSGHVIAVETHTTRIGGHLSQWAHCSRWLWLAADIVTTRALRHMLLRAAPFLLVGFDPG